MDNVFERLQDSLSNVLSYLEIALTTIRFVDIIDILIVAYVIYKVLTFVRRTSSGRVIRGIIFLIVVLYLSSFLHLNVISFLLGQTMELGILVVIVLFQPEIRKLLEQMGSKGILDIFGKQKKTETLENCITQTVLACAAMSEARIGALIVFERGIHLDDRIQTGTVLDAEPTSELYKTVFFPKTSLHDGACIIRNGRIVAAGCVLPTSNSQNISKELGMRHRAAIGMSAESDAVCVVVSEETGSISVAVGGMLKRHLAVDTFDKLLRNELITETKKKTISDITDFNDVINLLKEKLNVQRKSK